MSERSEDAADALANPATGTSLTDFRSMGLLV